MQIEFDSPLRLAIVAIALLIPACAGGTEGAETETAASPDAELQAPDPTGSSPDRAGQGGGELEVENARSRDGDVGGGDGDGATSADAGEVEENTAFIAADATWDELGEEVGLILRYDAAEGAFVGTVENITYSPLCGVQVEVHLESGTELGPTSRTNLVARQSIRISIPAGEHSVSNWTVQVETSACQG